MQKIHSYKDLIVWQKGVRLATAVYTLVEQFPKEELYEISSQMKRAAVSIPSNIAEGRRFGSNKEFAHFLSIAYGSGAELETQLEIVKSLPFGKKLRYTEVDSLLLEIMKMLNKILFSARS